MDINKIKEQYPPFKNKNGATLKDLTNKKIGKLTVLYRYYQNKQDNRPCWVCQCDCGNITVVSSHELNSGDTKSCGCLKKELLSERSIINEIGHKYGKLLVIARGKSKNTKNATWICKCDCGTIIEVLGKSLRQGHTTSCGCVKSTGERLISNFLMNHNINFIQQYSFNDLTGINNGLLKFDFCCFIDEKLILIEYDGVQHFQVGGWYDQNKLNYIQKHDELKNNYCKNNNIPLYRIPYYDINNIDIILKQIFKIK